MKEGKKKKKQDPNFMLPTEGEMEKQNADQNQGEVSKCQSWVQIL